MVSTTELVEFENPYSNGPTSKTTSEQSVGMNMNFEGTLQSLVNVQKQFSDMNKTIKQKDEEIRQLKEENDKLKKELKSAKSPDHLLNGRNNGHKIDELKRAVGKTIEDVLSEHSSRSNIPRSYISPQTAQTTSATILPVSVHASIADVNNQLASTNDSKPITSTIPDESTVLASSHMNPSSNNNQDTNFDHINQYTIFVSWPGTMTPEQLRDLFDSNDVEDIRYMTTKQFAHVDLKSEQALKSALLLHGQTKNELQGALRVECGKPQNGQRPQHQNKNLFRHNYKGHHQNHNNNSQFMSNSPDNNPYPESDLQNVSTFAQKQEHKQNGEM
ncbi:13970_t:CDS:10 [Funneliformis geosporum]|uniref:13970_t:CDS:1 n=1 Tax=Funneliformis geosporum TaxID=1117311 RepID=A0A9W4SSN5_9GLOM|nr:13970_t:CDS:10 [Funneliformis geosporum]